MEGFILYNEAVSLRELGFDELCLAWFSRYGSGTIHMGEGYNLVTREERRNVMKYPLHNSNFEYGKNKPSFSYLLTTAPTYRVAFLWFAKHHKLNSFIANGYNNYDETKDEYSDLEFWFTITEDKTESPYYKTYEEAELKCLQVLIGIVKKRNLNKTI